MWSDPTPMEVALRIVINGAATTVKVTLETEPMVMQAYAIPIDKALKRGWGYVEAADGFVSGEQRLLFRIR